MPAIQPALLLESEGVLGHLVTGLFQRELPPLLESRRGARVTLMVTTLLGDRLHEAEAQGNFYRPARLDRPPEFTWRATGAIEIVVRQWRLDFLRTLGPSELNCRILIRILDLEATGGQRQPATPEPSPAPTIPAPRPTTPEFDHITPPALPHQNGTPVASATPDTRSPIPVQSPIPETRNPIPVAPAQPVTRNPQPVLPGNLYQDYFGFERMPFNNTPDTYFYFPTPKHQEALSRLIWAISERKGFVMISGEIGAGKSTLCRTLLAQLPSSVHTALITHTHLDAKQLVRAIAEDLGIETTGLNEYEVLKRLTEFLIEKLAAGHTVCIIIDEAQNLSPAALEEVRMVSNIETEQEKLIQLILLGQPELRDKLRMPEMTQLRQRIASAYHLEPLDKEETAAYISHRLETAAPSRPLEFKKSAMAEVYHYSGGVPRLINTLCDNALLTAFTKDTRTITPAMIKAAALDLQLDARKGGFAEFFKLW